MGILKHGKYYWLDIRIAGKRIRRSLHTTKKLEAYYRFKEKRDELLAEYGEGNKTRFEDFCKKYLDWARTTKPTSALREQQRLKKIQDYFAAEYEIIALDEITPYHIESLKTELRKTGLIKDPEKQRPASKATVNRYLQILRGLFYKAIDWELYDKPNPVKKVRFYQEESPVEPLSSEDVNKILIATKKLSKKPGSRLQALFYDLVMFALNTGMRKSEILHLTWDRVRGDIVSITGKGERKRIVPLNIQAKAIIMRQLKKDEYVFNISNRRQPDLMRRTTQKIKKETGIDFHFHLLRHYFASQLLEKGVDIVTIGTILGHSSRMTSLLYSHTNKEQMRRAVDLIVDT